MWFRSQSGRLFNTCVIELDHVMPGTKGWVMAGLKKLLFAVVLAGSALLTDGCAAGCGGGNWLLRTSGDSIQSDTTHLNLLPSEQVCIGRAVED